MGYKDLREWIQQVDEMGELKVLEGVDWNLEIGTLTVLASKGKAGSPALLFDRIKGYPQGYRVLVGLFESLRRSALTTNLPTDISREGFIKSWRERLSHRPLIPPVTVKSGPILENVYEGKDIDMWKFPVPFWHEQDGGRYIGTADIIITRDPEGGSRWEPTGSWFMAGMKLGFGFPPENMAASTGQNISTRENPARWLPASVRILYFIWSPPGRSPSAVQSWIMWEASKESLWK